VTAHEKALIAEGPSTLALHGRSTSRKLDYLDCNPWDGYIQPGLSRTRTLSKRRIAATDGEIDQLVYQPYGLTDKEIKIVEEATGK